MEKTCNEQKLREEAEILLDPKAHLLRRLDALYALKHEAIKIHPLQLAFEDKICSAALERARHVRAKAADEDAKEAMRLSGSPSSNPDSLTSSPTQLSKASTPMSEAEVEKQQNTIRKKKQKEVHINLLDFVVQTYHKGIDPATNSVLLQHELLYNIGQLGSATSIPILCDVVRGVDKYHEVSRHEAIEAIGAIGQPDISIPALQEVMAGLPKEGLTLPITESAELAFARLELVKKFGQAHVVHEHAHRDFCSIDPAPATGSRDVKELRKTLIDAEHKCSLFERYQAMFTLRNCNNLSAVEALCAALVQDKTSALFRHEVAFVLGQMEYAISLPALKQILADENEHAMVRHEAAEAIGAIGNEEAKKVIQQYVGHSEQIVRDSCVAAVQLMDDELETEVKYSTMSPHKTVSTDMAGGEHTW